MHFGNGDKPNNIYEGAYPSSTHGLHCQNNLK